MRWRAYGLAAVVLLTANAARAGELAIGYFGEDANASATVDGVYYALEDVIFVPVQSGSHQVTTTVYGQSSSGQIYLSPSEATGWDESDEIWCLDVASDGFELFDFDECDEALFF